MEDVKELIHNREWDVLILLDACRFDMFKKVYREFFNGCELLQCLSPATHTPEFLFKVFTVGDWKDVVYVSGNAFCNSKNVPTSKFNFVGNKYFKKVMDVWLTGWSDELGTVPPGEVNKHAVIAMDLYKKARFIVHYMQPHAPYIYYGGGGSTLKSYWKRNVLTNGGGVDIRKKLRDIVFRFFSERTIWIVSRMLGKLPKNGMGSIWFKHGRAGYIRGYLEDLKLALGYVKQLVDRYPSKRFVVMSDHGERLGERGNYGHSKIYKRDRIILEVPWLEVG